MTFESHEKYCFTVSANTIVKREMKGKIVIILFKSTMNLSHTTLKLIIMVIFFFTRQFQHVSLFFKFKLFDNSFSVSVFWLDFNATPSHGLKFRNGYKKNRKLSGKARMGVRGRKLLLLLLLLLWKKIIILRIIIINTFKTCFFFSFKSVFLIKFFF